MNEEKKDWEVGTEIELDSDPAVIFLPPNAVELEMTVSVYLEGKVRKVMRTMDMAEIRAAFKNAEENWLDPDARFCLTEEGRKFIEAIRDEP